MFFAALSLLKMHIRYWQASYYGREGVLMRKLAAVICIFALALPLCGCRKTKVTMKVKEYRSGFGIAGQDLSGYKEYEVKNIKEGDVITGGFGGGELAVGEDTGNVAWLMKIGTISEDGVEVTTHDGTLIRSYGIPMSVESLMHMDDGPNYSYTVIFS